MGIEHLLSKDDREAVDRLRRRRQCVAEATAQIAFYYSVLLAAGQGPAGESLAEPDIQDKDELVVPPQVPSPEATPPLSKEEDDTPVLHSEELPKSTVKISDEDINKLIARGDYDRLIEALMPLIRYIIGRMKIDPRDYELAVADAMRGVWDAATRYDPANGKFKTFMWNRVRGAIRDGQREYYKINRMQGKDGKEDAKDDQNFEERENKKRPDRIREIILRPDTASIDAPLGSGEGGIADITIGDTVADEGLTPEQQVIASDMEEKRKAMMRAAILQLPSKQQAVLALRFGGMTYAQIGEQVGLTESRICQMIAEVENKLRVIIRQELREKGRRLDESWMGGWIDD